MYGTQAGGAPAKGAPPSNGTGKATTVVGGGAPPPAAIAGAPSKNARGAKKGAPIKEVIPMSDEAVALRLALDATQENLDYYKNRVNVLTQENATLQTTAGERDLDTMQVVANLKRELDQKDLDIRRMKDEQHVELKHLRQENELICEGLEKQVLDLKEEMASKDDSSRALQQELQAVKDFKKKRFEITRDLENQKAEMRDIETRHKETFTRMEHRFFEEKLRLQKEANARIAELALKAHKEAVANLDETTRLVYQENVRLSEALKYHTAEIESLKATNQTLQSRFKQLNDDKDFHNVLIKQKITQSKDQDTTIRQLRGKITSMEHSLTHIVREFEQEQQLLGQTTKQQLADVQEETTHLRTQLERKSKEMQYIKKLALHVLEQRSDVERFFHDAFAEVKDEIKAQNSLLNAYSAANKASTSSSTTTTADQKAPRKEVPPNDFGGMAWEQKERVLRVLFQKINKGEQLLQAR